MNSKNQNSILFIRLIITILILFFNVSVVYSQSQSKSDSLLSILKTTTTDTERAGIYAALCWENRYSDSSKVNEYGAKALAI